MKDLHSWLALIGMRTDHPDWLEVERAFDFTAASVELIHGLGRVRIKPAGIHVVFFKPRRGEPGPLEVCGFTFSAETRRGGSAYTGELPRGLRFGDSRESALASQQDLALEAESPGTVSWRADDMRLIAEFGPLDRGIREVTWVRTLDAIIRHWDATRPEPAASI